MYYFFSFSNWVLDTVHEKSIGAVVVKKHLEKDMAAYSTIILHHFVVIINSKNVKLIPTLMCSLQPGLGAWCSVFPQANFPLIPRVLVEQKVKYYFWLLQIKSQEILLISVASMRLLQAHLEVNKIWILNSMFPLGELKLKVHPKDWWISLIL